MENYILQYYQKINDGSITAGKWIKLLYQWVLDGIKNKEFYYDQKKAHKAIAFIEKFCRHHEGELGGQLIKLELWQKAFLSLVFGIVDVEKNRQFREILLVMGRKNGKALSLDTEIATPNGFVKMQDIHVGDLVFGQDGKASKVLAESEIFHKPMYAVTFEDGEVVKASEDHIWTIQTKRIRRKDAGYGKPLMTYYGRPIKADRTVDITTKEMVNDFVYVRADGKGVEYKYRVPMNLPVEYSKKELPLDPYTLGVWLGDGTRGAVEITCADGDIKEMISHLTEAGHKCRTKKSNEHCKAITLDSKDNPGGNGPYSNKTRNALKELGIFKDKFIPEIYMHSSIEQRMELLQGLMDTDGYCSKKGQCEFAQKSEKLVDQFRELAASLGIKTSKRLKKIMCNGKECEAYSILFFVSKNNPCFKLKRKKVRLKDELCDRMKFKSIVSIERIADEPSKCIAIDNESHLYLVGRNYTATHNTLLASAIATYCAYADGEYGARIYMAAPKLQQANICYDQCYQTIKKEPELERLAIKRRTDIYIEYSNSSIAPLAFSEKKSDGLNVSCAILDEIASWRGDAGLKFYEVIKSSVGARKQPLLLGITTSGYENDSVYDSLILRSTRMLLGDSGEKRLLPLLYMIDDIEKWNDIDELQKSNPNINVSVSAKYLLDELVIAENSLSKKGEFITKYACLKQNSSMAWLPAQVVKRMCGEHLNLEDFKSSYCVAGIDLSQSVDLTACTILIERGGELYVFAKFWMPSEKIDEAQARDGVPYRIYQQRGFLEESGQNFVDYHDCFRWLTSLVEDYEILPLVIGYDRYSASYLVQDLENYGFHCSSVYQGDNLHPVLQEMDGLFRDGKVHIGDNDLLKIHLLNSAIKVNAERGRGRLVKINSKMRIDGVASLSDAFCVRQHDYDMIGDRLKNE